MRQPSEFNAGVRGPVSEKVDQMEIRWTFKACLPPKGGGRLEWHQFPGQEEEHRQKGGLLG